MTTLDLTQPDPVCLSCPMLQSVRALAFARVEITCHKPDCTLPAEEEKEEKV